MSHRLATVDRDMELSEPPPAWNADWVRWRLVEAYRIERRLPGAARRRQQSLWPEHPHTFSDIVGWDEDGTGTASQRVLAVWSHAAGGVYATDVSRMDEAQEWLRVELKDQHSERACLAGWAACIAYKYSLRSLVLRKGWSRTSFYRRVENGSEHIASQLRANKVAVR